MSENISCPLHGDEMELNQTAVCGTKCCTLWPDPGREACMCVRVCVLSSDKRSVGLPGFLSGREGMDGGGGGQEQGLCKDTSCTLRSNYMVTDYNSRSRFFTFGRSVGYKTIIVHSTFFLFFCSSHFYRPCALVWGASRNSNAWNRLFFFFFLPIHFAPFRQHVAAGFRPVA